MSWLDLAQHLLAGLVGRVRLAGEEDMTGRSGSLPKRARPPMPQHRVARL